MVTVTCPIVALAGLAEMVLFYDFLICWAGLVVIGVVLLLAWGYRSWKIAAVALIFSVILGVLIRPWHALEPVGYQEDGDVVFWARLYLITSAVWLTEFALSVGTVVFIPFRDTIKNWWRIPPIQLNSGAYGGNSHKQHKGNRRSTMQVVGSEGN